MKNRPMRLLAVLALPLALVAGSCSKKDDAATTTTEKMAAETTTTMAKTTIVSAAAADPQFSTLVKFVTAAGLGDALSGDGPFTVFAPNNDAFAKLDAATVDALSKDPTGALASVLKLHVVSGKIMAADAVKADGTCLTTLNGGKITVTVVNGEVFVGGAKVIKPDVTVDNGVIHVIDTPIAKADC